MPRGAVNEVPGVGRQGGSSRRAGCFSAALEAQLVEEVHRLHDGFEFVEAVGAPAEDVQQQVDLAGRFFFRRMGFHESRKSASGKKRRRVGSNGLQPRSIVEHLEPAAGNERRDIAAAETHVGVGVEQAPRNQARLVAFRINGLGLDIIGQYRLIRRQGKVAISNAPMAVRATVWSKPRTKPAV